jgi:hypothetical protein
MPPLRKRLKRVTSLDWITLVLAAWAVLIPLALLLISLINGFVVQAPVWLLLIAPVVLYQTVSMWFVGRANASRPAIDRQSLLWAWLSFIGAAVRGGVVFVFGIAVGAFVSLVLGTGTNVQVDTIRELSVFLVLGLALWLALAIAVWTLRASMDVAGRRAELRANLLSWFEVKHPRRAKEWARFFEDGADVGVVITVGLSLVLAIGVVVVWIFGLLGY